MPTITIHNVESNEVITREMTKEEIAAMNPHEIKELTLEQKLMSLGLTSDDLKALGLD